MFGEFFDSVTKTIDKAIDDPFEFVIDTVTKPVRDVIEVVDGLTEGELRTKAALSLGIDVVAGMALSELIDWNQD